MKEGTYYAQHKRTMLPRAKRYYLDNRDTALSRGRVSTKIYYRNNKERVLAQHKAWKRANPDKVRLYIKKYSASEKGRATRARRSTRFRNPNVVSDVTHPWLVWLLSSTIVCSLCGKVMTEDGRYPDGKHLDHIQPLATGGLHMRANLQVICANCNVQKGARIQ